MHNNRQSTAEKIEAAKVDSHAPRNTQGSQGWSVYNGGSFGVKTLSFLSYNRISEYWQKRQGAEYKEREF